MTNENRPDKPAGEQESSFLSHLIELRDRLLRIVIAVLVLFIPLAVYASEIFNVFAGPLMRVLPEGATLINTKPADIVLVPFKLALLLAFVVALPYVLHQIWAFVAPGLYRHERRLAMPLLVSSVLLFYGGMAFAYFVVLPTLFQFFVSFAPSSVAVTTDIAPYLDFVLMMFLAFGIAFEVPVATVLLVAAGVTTPAALGAARPYIVVGVFTIAMFLTPPDMISQAMLAGPMWVLFEIGLIVSRAVARRKAERDAADEPEAQADRPLSEEEMDAELDRIEAEERGDLGRRPD